MSVTALVRAARSDMSSAARRGRLRVRFLPKVASKGCVASRCARAALRPSCPFSGSSSSDIGSFFSRSSTVYASFTLGAARNKMIEEPLKT